MPVYQFELCNAPDSEIAPVNNQTALSYTDAILRDTDYELAEPDEAHVVEYAVMVFLVIVCLFLLFGIYWCLRLCYCCNKYQCCLGCNYILEKKKGDTAEIY